MDTDFKRWMDGQGPKPARDLEKAAAPPTPVTPPPSIKGANGQVISPHADGETFPAVDFNLNRE